MYQIVVDNHDGDKFIIHDSRSNKLKVTNAVCELELNRTGSLTFKISPTHPNFSDLKKHMSEVYLLQDNEVIFCGRVLNDETDIYNFKTIVCEGMLGYLLDSVQRAKSYSLTGDSKIKDYLTDILKIHNSQVDDYKKFSVGSITEVDDSETFYKISSYESTLSTLNSDLIDTFNHTYLIPRIINDKKYIDYLTSNELPTALPKGSSIELTIVVIDLSSILPTLIINCAILTASSAVSISVPNPYFTLMIIWEAPDAIFLEIIVDKCC